MEKENKPEQVSSTKETSSSEKNKNPFENHQPVEKDIENSQEEIDYEQQFKEAQTERD